MHVHTFEDGQVIVLSMTESMALNAILNTYLSDRTDKLAAVLAEETFSADWS